MTSNTKEFLTITIDKSFNINNEYKKKEKNIKEKFEKKNILLLGAAGTIGSEILKKFIKYKPKKILMIDSNENDLIDLYRELITIDRSLPKILEYYPIDMLTPDLIRLIDTEDIKVIINCAASKHVRSQKNLIRNKRIFFNNLFINFYLLFNIKNKNKKIDFFCVSTDKSSSPKNLMGLTKNIMEDTLIYFDKKYKNISCYSSRFANVFMSKGSYLNYINKRQSRKIYVPKNVSRYFISKETAAKLSLISLLYSGKIVTPNESKLTPFSIESILNKIVHNNKLIKKIPSFIDDSLEKKIEEFTNKNEEVLIKDKIYVITKKKLNKKIIVNLINIFVKYKNFEILKEKSFSIFESHYQNILKQDFDKHLDNRP